MLRFLLVAILALPALSPALAQVSGRATVLSTDRFLLGGQMYKLFGVNGVEFNQYCFVEGRPWACGASGTRAMQTLLDPVVVTCNPTGETSAEARLAVCTSAEGDIAELITEQGWALADRDQTDDYVAAEEAARAAGAGVWQGVFQSPTAFRDDALAIGEAAARRSVDALLADAEEALLAENGGLRILEGFTVGTAANPAAVEHEFAIAGLGADPVNEAIEERDVFTWEAVARFLVDWRQSSLVGVLTAVSGFVWNDLAALPNEVVDVADAAAYYATMVDAAAAWQAEGRQPILLMVSPLVPSWIGEWFNGNAPPGAEITQRDIEAPGYLGTVDGIDVYVGQAPAIASLLFPSDMLASVTYRSVDGRLLEVVGGTANPTQLTLRYAVGFEWRDETVVWLKYPAEENTNPYDS